MTLAAPNDRAAELRIRSARFRAEREAGWVRLDALVGRAEKSGPRSLDYQEAIELAGLYRQAVNALSVARAISMDRALLAYLDALCARAYMVIYAPQESLRGAVGRLLARDIPRTVRGNVVPLLIGFLAMILGAVAGFVLVTQDPSWFYSLVPGDLAGERGPGASAEALRETLFRSMEDEHRDGALAAFASYLFSHNTQVAILTYGLGVFALAPAILLTFYNGTILGGFVAVFVAKDLGWELFGWLSIHGVTELSAFCIAAAGGARMGLAVVLPGERGRVDALREAGGDAVRLFGAAAIMLLAAAILEGFLR